MAFLFPVLILHKLFKGRLGYNQLSTLDTHTPDSPPSRYATNVQDSIVVYAQRIISSSPLIKLFHRGKPIDVAYASFSTVRLDLARYIHTTFLPFCEGLQIWLRRIDTVSACWYCFFFFFSKSLFSF